MDPVPLVDAQKEDGAQLLDRLTKEGFAVTAACWAKPIDESRWALYVASPVVDRLGWEAALRQVLEALRALGVNWTIHTNLRLIGAEHPIARHAAGLAELHRGPTQPLGPRLGDIFVDGAYIYPPQPGAPVDIATAP